MSLHLVTVATHSEGYLPVLEKQSEDKGLKLEKLAFGKKFKHWEHAIKDEEMMEYLKTIPSEDVVIFVDGFDSLMLGDVDEIKRKFDRCGAELLLSVENVTPWLSYIHAAVFERVFGKYINTGLYMGRAGFLLNFLKNMYSRPDYDRESNQVNWCNYLHTLRRSGKFDGIKLDNDSDIFLNHSFTTSNYPRLKDKRIHLGNSKPCFIQGNGREDMSYIIKATGYSDYNKHKGEFWWKKMKYNMRAVFKVYNPILTFYIFLCIILAIILIFFTWRYMKRRKDDHIYFG